MMLTALLAAATALQECELQHGSVIISFDDVDYTYCSDNSDIPTAQNVNEATLCAPYSPATPCCQALFNTCLLYTSDAADEP